MIILPDLTLWANQIKTQAPLFENRVFKTIPGDELQIDRQQSPTAFIYFSSDSSSENTLLTEISQQMNVSVTVEIILRRTATLSDQFNEADGDNIRLYRQELINALLGFFPDDSASPMEHSNGTLIKEKKLIKWVEVFNTDTYLSTV